MKRTLLQGDNLDVMRGMNAECVDLIYLDPPFNSNRNYSAPIGSKAAGAAFKDAWTLSDLDEAWHNEIADVNLPLYKAIDASGYTHGDGMKSYLIMMAVRLMEMRRLLKPTGSIYLHCDATASHYLKVLMDSIFGGGNFRNQITWRRISGAGKTSQHIQRSFGKSTDVLLFYSKGNNYTFKLVDLAVPYPNLNRDFPHEDERGRYKRRSPFRPPGLGPRPNLCYEYRGVFPPHESGWTVAKPRLREIDASGELDWVAVDRVYRKQRPGPGIMPNDVWVDINAAIGDERTGYPTQKPLALLERIIKASSNEGDVVLDPFCGCATTCIAAERLGRSWIGIDENESAVELSEKRLKSELRLSVENKIYRRLPDVYASSEPD